MLPNRVSVNVQSFIIKLKKKKIKLKCDQIASISRELKILNDLIKDNLSHFQLIMTETTQPLDDTRETFFSLSFYEKRSISTCISHFMINT